MWVAVVSVETTAVTALQLTPSSSLHHRAGERASASDPGQHRNPDPNSKLGDKLSKKKGYNVNDERAKDKDKKAKGAGTEEGETPKDNETQGAAETPEVKEDKEEKLEKDA